MCHLLNLTNSEVRFEMNPEELEIKAFCQVKTEGKTGVEMEGADRRVDGASDHIATMQRPLTSGW